MVPKSHMFKIIGNLEKATMSCPGFQIKRIYNALLLAIWPVTLPSLCLTLRIYKKVLIR